MLKDNPEFKQLPRFSGGSYSHLDRIYLPHTEIFLSKVEISSTGNLDAFKKDVDGIYQYGLLLLTSKSQI